MYYKISMAIAFSAFKIPSYQGERGKESQAARTGIHLYWETIRKMQCGGLDPGGI